MFGFFKRRRPAPLPVQALAAIVEQDPAPEYSALDLADGLPRRGVELHFGAGATAANEDEAIVMALGALEQHGPREAAAVLEGFVSVRKCLADAITVPDTDLIRAALSDGDNPALRSEVMVTPDGGLVHGDLTGGTR
jgi:hypothetical protein